MKDTEIKACPFCGRQGFLTETTSDKTIDHRHTVICAPGCGGSGMVGASPEEAIAAWNQRAGDREPATSQTPEPSTLASANGYDARMVDDLVRTVGIVALSGNSLPPKVVNGELVFEEGYTAGQHRLIVMRCRRMMKKHHLDKYRATTTEDSEE